jgi:hypothetical protein
MPSKEMLCIFQRLDEQLTASGLDTASTALAFGFNAKLVFLFDFSANMAAKEPTQIPASEKAILASEIIQKPNQVKELGGANIYSTAVSAKTSTHEDATLNNSINPLVATELRNLISDSDLSFRLSHAAFNNAI